VSKQTGSECTARGAGVPEVEELDVDAELVRRCILGPGFNRWPFETKADDFDSVDDDKYEWSYNRGGPIESDDVDE